jgi:hypothetical protein
MNTLEIACAVKVPHLLTAFLLALSCGCFSVNFVDHYTHFRRPVVRWVKAVVKRYCRKTSRSDDRVMVGDFYDRYGLEMRFEDYSDHCR